MVKIHCFFSGGRDSAVTCYLAKRVADVRKWQFVLVHVDTTIGLKETEEYVRQYAEWLQKVMATCSPTLLNYLDNRYVGKSCQGSCMI
jgi:3'-phosphoadenosine 5'-phosphosulfate sulfotransferase (PAPS reductase)/FAD synthetase